MIASHFTGLRPLSALTSRSTSASRTLLTIAGHDPSSGAGITADLQTFAAHCLFGTSVITALTVQSTLGVAEIQPVPSTFLQHALDNLYGDLPPVGIKIGMLGSIDAVRTVAAFLTSIRKQKIPIVLDPILRASSGADLLPLEAVEVLHQQLLPFVTWITPNWFELAALTFATKPIQNVAEAEAATVVLARHHPHLHIVATAGDQSQPTDILRLPSGEIHHFAGEHIETTSTHGTGCAFSSALLSLLVLRDTPIEAVRGAKHFVTEAIRHAPNLGHGRGPLNLLWHLT